MKSFIKNFALEIYTVTAMFLITGAALLGDLSVVQKFVVVYTCLFILHEWEEFKYPGGFAELIAKTIQIRLSAETKRASRIPTGIFLLLFSIVPFYCDGKAVFAVALAAFGIFEGIVHAVGIRIFHTKKPYTPGMITAEIELIAGVLLIIYLVRNHLGAWYDYVFGPFVFLACFMTMQKTLTLMVGIKYSNVPKLIKQQWQRKN
ncbi:MAG: HXXEE domain-containing protein [Verrucomicrobia bacterium]|nr:HXXEE domain-containing protein [Verrucomicrobiota bacterium]